LFSRKNIDRGILEFIGPFGFCLFLTNSANYLKELDNGKIAYYSLYI
jgi:hypothetical protein